MLNIGKAMLKENTIFYISIAGCWGFNFILFTALLKKYLRKFTRTKEKIFLGSKEERKKMTSKGKPIQKKKKKKRRRM